MVCAIPVLSRNSCSSSGRPVDWPNERNPDTDLDRLIAATRLSDSDATIPTMNPTEEVALPIGATNVGDYDLEDDLRLVKADLGGVVLYAEQDRDGGLGSIGALLDQNDNENGYSPVQLRELIPTRERAAALADQWAGHPANTLSAARVHATAAAEAITGLRAKLDNRGQFTAQIACIAAKGIDSLR